MKKWLVFALTAGGVPLLLRAQRLPSQCAAAPDPIVIVQPDGTSLTLQGEGNLYEPYSRTIDGYTVLHNPDDGGYYYAVKDARGLLVRSTVLAHDPPQRPPLEAHFVAKLPPRLRYHPVQRDLAVRAAHQLAAAHEAAGDVPLTGTVRLPVLLIEYPDLLHQFPKSNFDSLFNQTNYDGIGSVKDYFLEVSYGKLHLQFDIYGWFRAKNGYQTYGRSNGNSATHDLIREAIDSAEAAGVDWTPYDNDNDGDVDAVIVIHAGPGAEQGSRTQYIWSHRWAIWPPRSYDGKDISDYFVGPETRLRAGGEVMVRIGIMCHELGHNLGLPDLYDTDKDNGTSAGIGYWGLMGSGNWLGSEKRPSHMCGWSKAFLGWIRLDTITAGAHTLQPVAFDSSDIYLIPTPVAHEYFIVENRQQLGFDAALPGHGLAIWHINDSVINFTYQWNDDENLKAVDLEEADGQDDLDHNVNRGDAGDLFPGTYNRTQFTESTNPSSRNYNGASSQVRIVNISENNATKTVSFILGSYPVAVIQVIPHRPGYCIGDVVTLKSASRNADSVVWTLPDGQTIVGPSIQYTFPREDSFQFTLTAYNTATALSHSATVILSASPGAHAAFDVDSTEGLKVWFVNQSSGASAYRWDFGDGHSTYAFNPVHRYDQPGTYTVQLVAYAFGGCNDSTTLDVSVSGPGVGMAEHPRPPKCGLVWEAAGAARVPAQWQGGIARLFSAEGREIHRFQTTFPRTGPILRKGLYQLQIILPDGKGCIEKIWIP